MSAKAEKNTVPLTRIVTRTLNVLFRPGYRLYFVLYLLFGMVHSASWAVSAFVMQHFFDSIQNALTGIGTTGVVYWMAAAVVGLSLAQQALNSSHNFMGGMIGDKYTGLLGSTMHEKAERIDPVAFESTQMLTDIEKARAGGQSAMNIVANVIMTLTFYLFYFIIIGGYLFSLAPILALALPIIFVPSVLNVVVRVNVFSKLEDIAAPQRRRMEAHEKAIGDRQFFKETRTLGAFSYFKRQYEETLRLFNIANWRADRKTCLLELLLKAVTLCGYFGVLYILFSLLLGGTITLGAFAAVLGSLGTMIGIMDEMIARNMSEIANSLGKAGNFVRFLDLPERTGRIRPTGDASVVLRGARFRYPGAKKDSLRGVDLHIAAGETIAIVGENGAGKSTLVRLITGLYHPTEGSVKVRGVETRDAEPSALFSGISAVMQNYQRYKLTLKQNVQMGDPESADAIGPSAAKADLSIEEGAFPDGEETMLSREFDGVDLSGGQWQRVALARGFYRQHEMIVLDEPTAAIDPIEETKLYQKFAELSRGRTSVIVTHRLGSARIADRIVVMQDGGIEAIGTHEQLLRGGGKYAEMFHAQAQWYQGTAGAR